MKRSILVAMTAALPLFAMQGLERGERPAYVPGEAIVEYKAGFSPAKSHDDLKIAKIFSHIRERKDSGLFALVRSRETDTEDLILELRNDPAVMKVQPNYIHYLQAVPNDSDYDRQWNMKKIHAPQAWDRSRGSKDYVVAVFDTGVDYTHEDLRKNMWRNEAECNGTPGVDDDNDSVVDDCYGYDFADDDNDSGPDTPYGDNGHYHGTHVAGIIGAEGNNGKGVTGVNWHVSILSAKVFSSDGGATDSDILKAIDYLLTLKDKGVNIVAVNASYGPGSGHGGSRGDTMNDAIDALGKAGILFVAAAGNEGNDNDSYAKYPASYPSANLIAVAGTDQNDTLPDWSNYGKRSVDLAAPGKDIYSTMPGNDYAPLSGTSMATPHVTGAVALTWAALESHLGEINASQRSALIKRHIVNNVDRIPALRGKVLSGGRLNLAEALVNHLHARDDSDHTKIGKSVEIDVCANDEDRDGDPLKATEIRTVGDAFGTAEIVSDRPCTVRYTPPEGNETGLAHFDVNITDGIDVNVTKLDVNVTPNHPPVAHDDTATVTNDGTATIDVLSNDTDYDRDRLYIVSVSDPEHGTARISEDHTKIHYTADSGYTGEDHFSYIVSDGDDDHNASTLKGAVTLHVVQKSSGGGSGSGSSGGSSGGGGGDALGILGTIFSIGGFLLLGLMARRREEA